MQVWPAIDIRAGRCVRLVQGDYQQQQTYSDSALDMAHQWVAAGAPRLHLVDLDAARQPNLPHGDPSDSNTTEPDCLELQSQKKSCPSDSSPRSNADLIEQIIRTVGVPCQIGGGIRDEAIIQRFLAAGAAQLVCGSRAVQSPAWLAEMSERYPHRLVVGIDARDGLVATHGWLQTSSLAALDLAVQVSRLPIAAIVYTDIARDGMLLGPNFSAMGQMAAAVSTPIIASGGVTSDDDIRRLAELNLAGCIVGRALYEHRITLPAALAAAAGR